MQVFRVCQLIGSAKKPESSYRVKWEWNATEYFIDPVAIDFCTAIDSGDLAKLGSMMEDGFDVNQPGNDGMSFLLWAFAGDRFKEFALLLEKGAKSDVTTQSEFGSKRVFRIGTSVAHLSAAHDSPKWFNEVVKHPLNPNVIGASKWEGRSESLFEAVVMSRCKDKAERLSVLLSLNPSQQVMDNALRDCISTGEYSTAKLLLQKGADPFIYSMWGNGIHLIVSQEKQIHSHPKKRRDYDDLLDLVVSKGWDLKSARADVARWDRDLASDVSPNGVGTRRISELRKRAAEENRPYKELLGLE